MQKIVTFHVDEYGDEPEVCAAAPGRFHLLGEHTWFAQGNTLSMSINHYFYACSSSRIDNNFRLFSSSLFFFELCLKLLPLFLHFLGVRSEFKYLHLYHSSGSLNVLSGNPQTNTRY